MSESEKIESRICISAYNDSAALTRKLIYWANSPDARRCKTLNFGASSKLETEAVSALLESDKIQTIICLQLEEIYLSAEDFERLLTLPKLVELEISGGSSSDWNGPEYKYPSLSAAHYRVLATSPHAKKLQKLTFNNEEVSNETRAELLVALPNLQGLWVF